MPLAPLNPQQCVQVVSFDDENWMVIAPYEFRSETGAIVTVPAGFITDGASVPRCLWAAIPPFGRHFNAAVVHDALYRGAVLMGDGKKFPKCICDTFFMEIMQRDEVPLARRIAMYEAVKTLGYSSYINGKAQAAKSFAEEEARS